MAEGFGDVVVGARVQTGDLVDLVAARREHDDRYIRTGSQTPRDFDAAQVGQRDVEQHRIWRRLTARDGQGFSTRGCQLDDGAFLAQDERERLGLQWIVLHKNYPAGG